MNPVQREYSTKSNVNSQQQNETSELFRYSRAIFLLNNLTCDPNHSILILNFLIGFNLFYT